MESRPFGNTGLEVSAVGLGTGQIGDPKLGEDLVEELLLGALDAGVTLIDTARSYGLAEERIGRHLKHRRDEFVLATKGGSMSSFSIRARRTQPFATTFSRRSTARERRGR